MDFYKIWPLQILTSRPLPSGEQSQKTTVVHRLKVWIRKNVRENKETRDGFKEWKWTPVSSLLCVGNEDIRKQIRVDRRILDIINTKRLVWFDHVVRIPTCPKKLLKWVPTETETG